MSTTWQMKNHIRYCLRCFYQIDEVVAVETPLQEEYERQLRKHKGL